MFTVNLYRCLSAANVVDKELGLIDNPQGNLRSNSSIIDPVVVIQTDNNIVWRNECNYAYIPEFGRYYYITNIVSLSGALTGGPNPMNDAHLFEFHMHVDVLMSFKDQIREQTAIVARQESKYNLMLDDGSFMTYQNPLLQTLRFSAGSPFETQEFVLVVAGS